MVKMRFKNLSKFVVVCIKNGRFRLKTKLKMGHHVKQILFYMMTTPFSRLVIFEEYILTKIRTVQNKNREINKNFILIGVVN